MFDKTVIFADKNDEKGKARIRKEMDQVLAFQKKLIQVRVSCTAVVSQPACLHKVVSIYQRRE